MAARSDQQTFEILQEVQDEHQPTEMPSCSRPRQAKNSTSTLLDPDGGQEHQMHNQGQVPRIDHKPAARMERARRGTVKKVRAVP